MDLKNIPVDKMPFGKHAGISIEEIPTEYLNWVLSQDWVWKSLKEKIQSVVEKRPPVHSSGPDDDFYIGFDEYEFEDDW